MLNSRYLKNIFFLFLSLSSLNSHAADQDKNETSHAVEAFTVQLGAAVINTSGLQTQQLHTIQFSPEIETFATRIDLSPLIDSRKRYFTALAKQVTANIKYQQSQQDMQRLENLQREKAVSKRKLLAQKSQLKLDKTNFLSAKQQAEVIRLRTRSKWGGVLSHWFLSEEFPYNHMINTLNKSIYLVYLPQAIHHPLPTISIHPFGLRDKAQTASLISGAAIHNTQ